MCLLSLICTGNVRRFPSSSLQITGSLVSIRCNNNNNNNNNNNSYNNNNKNNNNNNIYNNNNNNNNNNNIFIIIILIFFIFNVDVDLMNVHQFSIWSTCTKQIYNIVNIIKMLKLY